MASIVRDAELVVVLVVVVAGVAGEAVVAPTASAAAAGGCNEPNEVAIVRGFWGLNVVAGAATAFSIDCVPPSEIRQGPAGCGDRGVSGVSIGGAARATGTVTVT